MSHMPVYLRLLHPGSHIPQLSQLPHLILRPDGIQHSLVDSLEHPALILKLHLAFLGMHIYINSILRHLNIQCHQRIAGLGYQGMISIINGLGNSAIGNNPAVDNKGLPAAAAPDS